MENIGHQGKKKSGFPSLVGKIGQKTVMHQLFTCCFNNVQTKLVK
jgi:hypothetical protein